MDYDKNIVLLLIIRKCIKMQNNDVMNIYLDNWYTMVSITKWMNENKYNVILEIHLNVINNFNHNR